MFCLTCKTRVCNGKWGQLSIFLRKTLYFTLQRSQQAEGEGEGEGET
jgi:hypothetical protein